MKDSRALIITLNAIQEKGMGFREEKVSERQREVIKASKKLIEKEGDFSTATTVHLKHTSLSPL